MIQPLRGLYAITDAGLIPASRFVATVEQAILGGARIIQYRDKSNAVAQRLARAEALQALCQRHDVPLIINDDVELAASVSAAGVHLGQDDAAIATARDRLGSKALIGASCYNRLDRALAAALAGADYVAFGGFFPSLTKPDTVSADTRLLRRARRLLELPIVAIGGITPANGGSLVAAGADCLAVIHGLFGQTDVLAAANAYTALFSIEPRQGQQSAR